LFVGKEKFRQLNMRNVKNLRQTRTSRNGAVEFVLIAAMIVGSFFLIKILSESMAKALSETMPYLSLSSAREFAYASEVLVFTAVLMGERWVAKVLGLLLLVLALTPSAATVFGEWDYFEAKMKEYSAEVKEGKKLKELKEEAYKKEKALEEAKKRYDNYSLRVRQSPSVARSLLASLNKASEERDKAAEDLREYKTPQKPSLPHSFFTAGAEIILRTVAFGFLFLSGAMLRAKLGGGGEQ
jgi:uncharacterized cupredoxin-like copper-binding protein